MPNRVWQFNTEQFNRLFPFHLQVNREMRIDSCGKSLEKICPGMEGADALSFFEVNRPLLEHQDFESWKTLTNQLVNLKCKSGGGFLLRGQFETIHEDKLMFVGSPWFGSIEQVRENKLDLHDFAFHDPLIDLLHVLKTQEITNEDLKQLLSTVNRQKNELKVAAKELKVLSKIAEDNINAVVIADAEGRITWANKSFIKMTGYEMEEIIGQKPGYLLQGQETDPATISYLSSQIKLGESFDAEILNYTKDGKKYWVRIQGQPILNERNEVTGFFALEEDITNDKEILNKIKESEQLFRTALEKIGDNVWEHDFRTGVTHFSNSNNEFLGLDISNESDNNQLWWDHVHQDDMYMLQDNDQQIRSGISSSHNLEYRMVREDGQIRWVLDRGVVIEKTPDGKPLRLIGSHTDITSIKQTEEELSRHVSQFRSLSENVPGVIYEYEFRKDGSEGFRYLSPAIERVFGVTTEDFIAFEKYIDPSDALRIAEKNKRSRETLEPYFDESRLHIPGKGIIWRSVSSSYSYTTPEGNVVYTGFMLDITSRKMAEDALRTNEEKYRSIIDNMKLGLLEVDKEDQIVFTNQAFCDMCGYSREELIGKKASAILVKGSSAITIQEKNDERIRGYSDAYEVAINNKAGEERWWLISGAPRYTDQGNVIGSIGIHLDITEQKLLQSELIFAREQAEQLAMAKEHFLANMSHEIRTPMNAIIGMSHQLAKMDLTAKQRFYLDNIHAAADNLLVIINDILDMSKIEAGKLSVEHIPFDPRDLVGKAMTVLAYKAEEKGLLFRNSFFDDTVAPVLVGDPYRLNQVLLNLMSNAIKFTDHGSVDVRCECLEDAGEWQTLRICIEDTGVGMDDAFLAHLFDKFTQEFDSNSRQYGGSGLGMSICKEIIGLMGGTISVTSEKGHGTIVYVDIPLRKGLPSELKNESRILDDTGLIEGKTILIADDNDMNRLVAEIILENAGAISLKASNGREALDLLKTRPVDLVLMDLQMPVMSGYEAIRVIRDEMKMNIPVIALTANALKGEQEKCLDAGMNDYLSKPFKENDLLARISYWVKKDMVNTTQPFAPENLKESVNDLYDLAELEEISRGNPSFVKKMIVLFCSQAPVLVDQMEQAFHSGDLAGMGRIAHQLKPSIDNLRITQLKQVVRNIEKAGKEKEQDASLGTWIAEMKRVVALVTDQVKRQFDIS